MKRKGGWAGWVAGVLATAATLVGPQRASAQLGAGMDMSAMIAPISSRSLESYARILSLDGDQKEAAKALLEGYQAQHRAAVDAFQTEMKSLTPRAIQEEMQQSQDWMSYGRKVRDMGIKLREGVQGSERNFMEDLKVLLTEKQAEGFVRVERARRRENLLRFGFVAGQAVDLFSVAENAKVGARAEVVELLASYEVEVDRRLEAFERWQRDQEKQFDNVDPMNVDMGAVSKAMQDAFDRSREIRDVNQRFARQIAQALGEGDGERFTDEFKRRAHPRVYRPSHAAKSIRSAEGFADLGEQQRADLKVLRESFEREAAAANARWASVIEAEEDKRGANWMEEMMQQAMGGGGKGGDVADAKQAREDLDSRTMDRLLAILSKEQAERLPAKPEPKPSQLGPAADMFYLPDLDPENP
ncbi:MAG: hypothetical protein FJ255_10460 [Phycisphaerae bacterium]|nr:hypothetical protein [Phycisphaerae bacterium]